ncbi:hypothetical protein GQ457_13G016330 [Hibiscus cannabinus]
MEMNQARLVYCSFEINCQCFYFFYNGASIFCFDWMTKGMSRQETTSPALADYLSWNQISVEHLAEAVTSFYPLSQGSLPYKAKLGCIFLAVETLSIPISRRS